MNTIHIIYHQFYDKQGKEIQIGGVETYIANLARVLVSEKKKVIIYQAAKNNFAREVEGFKIVGISVGDRKIFQKIVQYVEGIADTENDVLLFGADIAIVNSKFKKVIAIQHGIGWDIPATNTISVLERYRHFAKNVATAIKRYNQYKKCSEVVCVDYNFVNWYRTFWKTGSEKLHVIPNFATIPENNEKKSKERVSIIFARRFQEFRGTRVFAEAVTEILNMYPETEICVAGSGPDESWLREKLERFEQVTFTRFAPKDSIDIHKKFDIAVVPSIGSEGTSLSLLEAMAAGCAVVASDVGGLSNIVIDGYNGIIIRSEKNRLVEALDTLIQNREYREMLAERGFETVRNAFSFTVWSQKWLQVLD